MHLFFWNIHYKPPSKARGGLKESDQSPDSESKNGENQKTPFCKKSTILCRYFEYL